MSWPFLTASVVSSGIWIVWPRNGVSSTTGLCVTTRPKRRLPGRRTVIPADGAPPRRSLKNAICRAPGLDSRMVQATMRPLSGAFIRPRFVPTFAW
jgi:hypothetical protein